MDNISAINNLLALGNIAEKGLFPHLESLKESPFIFNIDFGLKTLPTEPGILLIRGARQYGKSTWLEGQIRDTIREFGAGSAFYLNGDYISDADHLERELITLSASFASNAAVQRIFIDEITAIPRWEYVLKKLVDNRLLARALIITTGSKATDLRRGAEKLPGRKGKLSRSTYLFTPLAYQEFHRVCNKTLGKKTLIAYLLSGGSPIACAELAARGSIPEYVIELTRDWIEGEVAASGRSRASLLNIMSTLYRFSGSPIGQAKLAREAGLANNTVAANYMELLNDLGCVVPAYPFDFAKNILILRKQCKYHFTNLLAAISFYQTRIRHPEDFLLLSESEQAMWYEWAVAQELQRRAALEGASILAPLAFWQDKNNEIDFVVPPHEFIEVKRGRSSALEFGWFIHKFPRNKLTVINSQSFSTATISGISLEDFLLQKE